MKVQGLRAEIGLRQDVLVSQNVVLRNTCGQEELTISRILPSSWERYKGTTAYWATFLPRWSRMVAIIGFVVKAVLILNSVKQLKSHGLAQVRVESTVEAPGPQWRLLPRDSAVPTSPDLGVFRKLGAPCFGVLLIRILLFGVLC